MLFCLLATVSLSNAFAKQAAPDAKRQREIRAALIVHGYEPGKTWPEVVTVLKQIARQHHWQSKHAPDARVLILLNLGNRYSDSNVLDGYTRLDPAR